MNKAMSETTDEHEPKRRTRVAQADERRRSLVLAAYNLIAVKGFEQLRTRDIAAQAGVNIATLHYYFASKEALIQGVVEHLLHEFSNAPISVVEDTTPLGQIKAMFLMTYSRFQTSSEMFVVLEELVLRSLRDPSIRSALRRLDGEWHAYLRSVVSSGIYQGMFRAGLDPDITATELIMLIKGCSLHYITSPETIDIHHVLGDVERLLL